VQVRYGVRAAAMYLEVSQTNGQKQTGKRANGQTGGQTGKQANKQTGKRANGQQRSRAKITASNKRE